MRYTYRESADGLSAYVERLEQAVEELKANKDTNDIARARISFHVSDTGHRLNTWGKNIEDITKIKEQIEELKRENEKMRENLV